MEEDNGRQPVPQLEQFPEKDRPYLAGLPWGKLQRVALDWGVFQVGDYRYLQVKVEGEFATRMRVERLYKLYDHTVATGICDGVRLPLILETSRRDDGAVAAARNGWRR